MSAIFSWFVLPPIDDVRRQMVPSYWLSQDFGPRRSYFRFGKIRRGKLFPAPRSKRFTLQLPESRPSSANKDALVTGENNWPTFPTAVELSKL
jgi:hypothetical protein